MIGIQSEVIESIVVPAWALLLDLTVEQAADLQPVLANWSASVGFSGPVTGEVRVDLPADLAQRVAQTMFGIPDVSEDEIGDAVGELANVLAGNVKTAVASKISMGLPNVVQLDGSQPAGPGTAFTCGADHFVVSVEFSEEAEA